MSRKPTLLYGFVEGLVNTFYFCVPQETCGIFETGGIIFDYAFGT